MGRRSVLATWVGSRSMIGRIPITDVTPVVDCGRWPAKAVGRRDRPGHRHGFPRGPRHGRRRTSSVTRPDGASAAVQPDADAPRHRHGTDRWATEFAVDAEGCGRSASRRGATRSAPGGTTPRSRSRSARTSTSSARTGALLHERAAEARPRPAGRAIAEGASARCATPTAPPRTGIAPALDPDLCRRRRRASGARAA